ncbi:hypothetical protein E2C01_095331 [Portunus trituberculatus]|uniref:Uncharacterized protein n=1 Tax=Portunus trituberculatus TaxID=210409 RepID=A0A5B7JZ45_PORTR|nr:hypothetical protein [Portunus trituberculatus]
MIKTPRSCGCTPSWPWLGSPIVTVRSTSQTARSTRTKARRALRPSPVESSLSQGLPTTTKVKLKLEQSGQKSVDAATRRAVMGSHITLVPPSLRHLKAGARRAETQPVYQAHPLQKEIRKQTACYSTTTASQPLDASK